MNVIEHTPESARRWFWDYWFKAGGTILKRTYTGEWT